jgi:hypothetical protein
LPADTKEQVRFAQLCYYKRFYDASAAWFEKAFASQPQLVEDVQTEQCYQAACAAARAGCGDGEDAANLSDKARARRRERALLWLQDDLGRYGKILKGGRPDARAVVWARLWDCRTNPDLAGLREEAALAKLPEAERQRCRRLWAEVDALRARTGGPTAIADQAGSRNNDGSQERP